MTDHGPAKISDSIHVMVARIDERTRCLPELQKKLSEHIENHGLHGEITRTIITEEIGKCQASHRTSRSPRAPMTGKAQALVVTAAITAAGGVVVLLLRALGIAIGG